MTLHRTRLLVLAAVMLTALPLVRAAEPATGKGSIKGTVTTSDGRPAEKVVVRIVSLAGLDDDGGVKKPPRRRSELTQPPSALAAGKPVAQTLTDAQGGFEVKDIAAGNYLYRIGDPTTVGYISGRVTVEADKTAEVTAKLNPPVKG